jgi:hypothetical protein
LLHQLEVFGAIATAEKIVATNVKRLVVNIHPAARFNTIDREPMQLNNQDGAP